MRATKELHECLRINNHDPDELKMEDMTSHLVGEVCEYLENKGLSNRSYNKKIGFFSYLWNWHFKANNIISVNHFEKVKKKPLNPNPQAITYKEYVDLIKIITKENGIKQYEKGVKPKRNLYRSWLENSVKLGILGGFRREELLSLRNSDVVIEPDGGYIKCFDIKTNLKQNRFKDEEKKIKYIPLTSSLMEALLEMGYSKDSDDFILAPEITENRKKVMCDDMSRGFSHYYDQLQTGRKLTFKSLRKKYITSLKIHLGTNNVKDSSGHSNDSVIDNFYIDKAEFAKSISRTFNVFSKEIQRNSELEHLRKETKSQSQNKEIE